MATPSLPSISSFDVGTGITITYEANNGYDTITKSEVYILDAESNPIGHHVYTGTSSAQMATTHILSPKSVTYDSSTGIGWQWEQGKSANNFNNNEQYQMYIIWYNNASTPAASDRSNYIGVWTLPNPTIRLQPDETVYVTTYTITAIYDKNNAIINNTPSATQFYLYLITNPETLASELVSTSPVLYTSGIAGNNGTYQLSYTFNGLESGKTYYFIVKTITTQGMIAIDGTNKDKTIRPSIPGVQINTLEAKTDDERGCVDLSASITNITGVLNDDPSAPIDCRSTGLDLTSDYLRFKDGLAFANNWNFSFWANNFNYADNINAGSTQYILHLSNIDTLENGIIDVFMVHNNDDNNPKHKAVMCVYPLGYDSVCSYFESNELTPKSGTTDFVCVQMQYKDFSYYINIADKVIT